MILRPRETSQRMAPTLTSVDSYSPTGVKPAQQVNARSTVRHIPMNCRRHVTVQLVRENGTRITGVTLSPLRVISACLVLVVGGLGLGFLTGEWIRLRGVEHEKIAVSDQSLAQRSFIASVTAEITNLRREVATWRALHANILEAFGPAAEPVGGGRGIGGAVALPARVPAPLTPSEELNALSAEIQQAGASLRVLKRLVGRASRALAALPSTWPVRGAVNSEFGARVSPWSRAQEFHAGIDIAAPPGTPVHAPAAGTVIFAGAHHEYGVAVILDHGQDIRTVYAHLMKARVSVGQYVTRGAELGLSGSTGRSSGPHLHYEILMGGQAVNPRSFLWD
jgi:murein DD-endopeptidase MepM/ murein hydrolase activator NlpD